MYYYFLGQKPSSPFLKNKNKYLTNSNFEFYFWQLFFDARWIFCKFPKKYLFSRSLWFFENEKFAARILWNWTLKNNANQLQCALSKIEKKCKSLHPNADVSHVSSKVFSSKQFNSNVFKNTLLFATLILLEYSTDQRIFMDKELTVAPFVITTSVFCCRKPEAIRKTTPEPLLAE